LRADTNNNKFSAEFNIHFNFFVKAKVDLFASFPKTHEFHHIFETSISSDYSPELKPVQFFTQLRRNYTCKRLIPKLSNTHTHTQTNERPKKKRNKTLFITQITTRSSLVPLTQFIFTADKEKELCTWGGGSLSSVDTVAADTSVASREEIAAVKV
jgi:hypothetical protein